MNKNIKMFNDFNAGVTNFPLHVTIVNLWLSFSRQIPKLILLSSDYRERSFAFRRCTMVLLRTSIPFANLALPWRIFILRIDQFLYRAMSGIFWRWRTVQLNSLNLFCSSAPNSYSPLKAHRKLTKHNLATKAKNIN